VVSVVRVQVLRTIDVVLLFEFALLEHSLRQSESVDNSLPGNEGAELDLPVMGGVVNLVLEAEDAFLLESSLRLVLRDGAVYLLKGLDLN